MNRFFDIAFIPSRELMPWEAEKRGLSVTTGLFELAQMIRLRSDIAGGVIELDAGFISDLASIPGLLEWLTMATDDQRISGGSWFHDYLYQNGGRCPIYDESGAFIKIVQLTRKQCDQILCYEAMPDLGASKADCWKVYTGLAIGGRFNFKKNPIT